MGNKLEREIGSLQFLYLILCFSVIGHLLAALIQAAMLNLYIDLFQQSYKCSLGFSGVLFGLLVVESTYSQASHQSIFGLFRVPTKYYPWALMLAIQVVFSSASFIGHLGGILVGYLCTLAAVVVVTAT